MINLDVIKRDSVTVEAFTPEKIYKPLKWACIDIENVSISEIMLKLAARLAGRKSITSSDLHEELIGATKDCINAEFPNYDIVAGRLVTYQIRKQAYGSYEAPHISIILATGIMAKRYDPEIASYYDAEEWDAINSMIDHSRDDLFRYAGAQQMREKYLVKNRVTGRIFESMQIPYILAGAVTFSSYPRETRLHWIKEFYDVSSQHDISLPTPIMGGVRTLTRQYSSCVLLETGDDLDGIANANVVAQKYVAKRAGEGINVGQIRGLGAAINGGEVKHTGVIPFIKQLAATVKSCSKGGIRDGAVTFYLPVWHMEFPEVVRLRDNSLTEESTCFAGDYCIQFNGFFWRRLVQKGNITLFSPGEDETPGLYEAFVGKDQKLFEELYTKYENDPTIRKRTLTAEEVFGLFATQRGDTARIYGMNIDLANKKSPFRAPIRMSNLCLEILLPTGMLKHIDDGIDRGAEISLCTLGAVNWGKITKPSDFERPCTVLVRALDALLDYQSYPFRAAEESTKKRRPLGIGIIGFAHFLAKRGMYYHKASMPLVDEYAEAWAYYLTKASIDLAEEKGPCELWKETRYSDGWLPMDSRSEFLDTLLPHKERMPWGVLRERVKVVGIRNSTLMALMPSETSSQLANETNGLEAPRSPVVHKGENGELPIVVPDLENLGGTYDWAWEQKTPRGYLEVTAAVCKYLDQTFSLNMTYNPKFYPDGKIGTSTILGDLMYAYKLGHVTAYYHNVYKAGQDDIDNMASEACAGGACKI